MTVPAFFRLDGRVALVTGGGQGIGAKICERLAAAGAKVAVFDRDAAKASRVAHEIGGHAVAGDITSETDVDSALDDVADHLGPVDLLVNNAGITGKAGKLWEISLDDWKQVMDVNVLGTVVFCRAVVPGMRERKFGRIVNIASIAGKEGNPTLGPYSASKAAVIAFTKSLAKELVQQGDITVNSIAPAVIHTPILDGLPQSTVDYMLSKIPMGRPGKTEEVAALVHFLVSNEASFTTGQCYDISGGRATY
jgi:NAD(P)-dependent dehydrogenase (short-subunit alcohol dehydrogenase family)